MAKEELVLILSFDQITRIFETEANAKADMPGPGQYIDPGAASQSKDALRSNAVFKSSITREKAVLGKASNQEVPGPGAYHEPAKTFASGTKPEHLQFFGSTSTRFDSSQRFVSFFAASCCCLSDSYEGL